MEEFKKTITVQGSSDEHTITISVSDGKLKMHCDCPAGIRHQLCKHVIGVARNDIELQPYVADVNLTSAFDDYYFANAEIERLQAEKRRLRKKIEKVIL